MAEYVGSMHHRFIDAHISIMTFLTNHVWRSPTVGIAYFAAMSFAYFAAINWVGFHQSSPLTLPTALYSFNLDSDIHDWFRFLMPIFVLFYPNDFQNLSDWIWIFVICIRCGCRLLNHEMHLIPIKICRLFLRVCARGVLHSKFFCQYHAISGFRLYQIALGCESFSGGSLWI